MSDVTQFLRKRLQSVLAEDHPKGSPQGPSAAEKPRQSLIQVTHLKLSQLSLESECCIKDNVYDGYNNDTFLMFVPTICIISSHKLSLARIRHEADMSSHENIIEYIHTLCLMPLIVNLQSTFHRLYTIISWLR